MKIISKQNQAVLVEWRDNENILRRSIIPADDATPEPEQLAAGIPFGVAWELSESATHKLAVKLHEHGIWTYADAANRIRDFRAIVNEVVVASLLDAARQAR